MLFGWLVYKSNDIKYYTYLSDVFKNNYNTVLRYNWLISDFECNYYPEQLIDTKQTFITGDELYSIITSENEPQFIWGILSSVEKNEPLKNVEEITSEGYNGYWDKLFKMQREKSEIEIGCFDSTEFVFITQNKEYSDNFKKEHPESKELSEYNEKYGIKGES